MGKSLADEEYGERCQNKNAEKYKQKVRERNNWHDKNLKQLRLNFIKIEKQFVYQRCIPETSCLCQAFENIVLIGKALRRYKCDHPTSANHIEDKYCCHSTEFLCISSTCRKGSVTNVNAKLNEGSDLESGNVEMTVADDSQGFLQVWRTWVGEKGSLKFRTWTLANTWAKYGGLSIRNLLQGSRWSS